MNARLSSGAEGITLLETLFAAALGAVILGALLALYQRGLTGHAFATARDALIKKVFVIDRLFTDELHVAQGFVCNPEATGFNLLNRAHTKDWLRLFKNPVQVSDDSIDVLKIGAPVVLENHNIERAQFELTSSAPFERGGLLVVCDDKVSVLLQITRTANGKRSFGYKPTDSVRPGNCDAPFSRDGCGPEGYRFEPGALVASYRPVSFFIASTGERSPSLRRRQLIIANTSGGIATAKLLSEEVAENVISLKALAGVTVAPNNLRLTPTPEKKKALFLEIGFVAGVKVNVATPPRDGPLYLLGEPVALPVDEATAKQLFMSHELSVRL